MIRVVLFLISVALIALGVAWFADRPGEVSIVWLGYRLDTSIFVAAFAIIVLAIAVIAVWSLVRAVVRSPDQVSLFLRHRRAIKGYLAITRGLIAIGSGDLRLARRSAADAARLTPGDPLALLLSAQAAQMEGDRDGAEQAFRVMVARDDTKLLGLRGLYIEAQRRNDPNAARRFAEQAAEVAPGAAWAGKAALDFRCAAGDWSGALEALEAMKSSLEKPAYRRQRAVLLTARALSLEETDRDASRAMALEAVKLAPNFVPAATLAGRRLAESGEVRKAGKILDAAWQASPHPDIAEAYANLRLGDSARDRRVRVKRLAAKMPDHIESALALSRAAVDAGDFAAARGALAPYVHAPTRRVATLMAEIEEREHGDEGRARAWMSRAMRAAPDPAWTADGVVSERWIPVSPVSGRLDAFEWRLPLAEIGVERPVIEPDLTTSPRGIDTAADLAPAGDKPIRRSNAATKSDLKPAGKSQLRGAAKQPPAEPVIPLIHAPDDPGPDPALESDPVPEPTLPPSDGWSRIRQLFR
ncbi:MAG: heme biosynthesis protein HemY [Pseudolabrys sp.]